MSIQPARQATLDFGSKESPAESSNVVLRKHACLILNYQYLFFFVFELQEAFDVLNKVSTFESQEYSGEEMSRFQMENTVQSPAARSILQLKGIIAMQKRGLSTVK